MQTIKEILNTDDGIDFSLLKAASKSGPLGKNWVCIFMKNLRVLR